MISIERLVTNQHFYTSLITVQLQAADTIGNLARKFKPRMVESKPRKCKCKIRSMISIQNKYQTDKSTRETLLRTGFLWERIVKKCNIMSLDANDVAQCYDSSNYVAILKTSFCLMLQI